MNVWTSECAVLIQTLALNGGVEKRKAERSFCGAFRPFTTTVSISLTVSRYPRDRLPVRLTSLFDEETSGFIANTIDEAAAGGGAVEPPESSADKCLPALRNAANRMAQEYLSIYYAFPPLSQRRQELATPARRRGCQNSHGSEKEGAR
jgi:hypothetical protein